LRRIRARHGAGALLLLAAMTPLANAWPIKQAPAGGDPGCDSLAGEPVNYRVVFEEDIQPYLGGTFKPQVMEYCEACHVDLSFGSMSLAPINVTQNLIGLDGAGQPSSGYEYRRVAPGNPQQSLLFLRLNCADAPATGGRMPPGSTGGAEDPQYLRLEALVHDWIKSGAIMNGSDRIFQANFDVLR